MAITKIGAPLSGIRGTIGGITYSANKSGPYAKQWAPSTNPRTAPQSNQRSYLSQMPTLWNAMTDVQRAAWDTFAALGAQELFNSLGESYYASGNNWHAKTNVRLIRMGLATIVPVPTQARPAAPTIDDFRVCIPGTESDLCVCGVPSSDSERVGFEADKAFDNNLGTGWFTAVGVTVAWLRYDFCTPQNVKRYRIYSSSTVATWAARDWTFEVFTAGAWQVIHTVTDGPRDPVGWHDFYCANPYTETDYRINITLNWGSANDLGVMEVEMYTADIGASVVCYPEDEFADAPDWDLVLNVSMGRSIGMQVQYPGYYNLVLNSAPGRWFQLFQDEAEDKFGTIQMNRSWFAQFARQTTQGIRSAWQTERTVTIGG